MNRENRFLRRQLIRKFMYYSKSVRACTGKVRIIESLITFMVSKSND